MRQLVLRIVAAMVVAMALVAPLIAGAPARADEAPESAFFAGARIGLALPIGTALDNIDFMLPVWIEAGYAWNGRIYLGADFLFGWVKQTSPDFVGGTNCSCSVHVLQIGGEGAYHFRPGNQFDPWVGLGIGFERLTVGSAGFGNADTSGLTWDLQVALDIALAKGVSVGPFFTASFGSFGSASAIDGFGQPIPGVSADSGIHTWLMLGVRGQVSD